MPFGEHSTERYSGSARGARSRPSSRDASIDEILKSIQQIIDEDPLTMRPGARNPSEQAARPRSSDKPVRVLIEDDAPAKQALRRSARILKPAADDDVLAELLAPQLETETPAPIVAAAPVVEEEARVAPFMPVEAVSAQAAPEAAAPVEIAVVAAGPEVTAVAPSAPVESEPMASVATDVTAEAVTPTEDVPAAESAAAPEVQIAVEPTVAVAEVALTTTADDLLQSLAAGLGALGAFETPAVAAAPSVVVPEAVADAHIEATPEQPITARALTPQEAAAAAVAEVVAANAPPAALPEAVEAVVAPSAEPEAILQPAEVAVDAVHVELVPQVADVAAEASAGPSALPPALAEGLDDAITTMLRPLLREWLDAHLPRMVEKALKEELAERPLTASLNASA